MKQVLYYASWALATLTIPSFVVTMVLFSQGSWHLGKRILATTAVLGFLLAVAVLGIALLR